MANTTPTADDLRKAKYEGFIRHTTVKHSAEDTTARFSRYKELDAKREQKMTDLHSAILAGCKA